MQVVIIEGSFAILEKSFSEVGFSLDFLLDDERCVESTALWDVFYEAKEAIVKGNNSSGVGHLRDFFKGVNFEKLRKDIKQEHKDEAIFNWLVATKILQPLSGGLVFIDVKI